VPVGSYAGPRIPYERRCPPPAWITAFHGRAGSRIDALGPMVCSDGAILNPIGVPGGTAWSSSSATGYANISVRAGEGLNELGLVPATSGSKALYGAGGGDLRPVRACPAGMVIAGVYGNYSVTTSAVTTVGVICRTAPGV
jgi:hypothetical protein